MLVKKRIFFFTVKFTSIVILEKICSAVRQATCFTGGSEQSGELGNKICFNGEEFEAMAVISWTENSNVYYKTPSSPNFECFIAGRPLLCLQLCILRVN
jgi:hypothetical protein